MLLEAQKTLTDKCRKNGYKTLVSCDYDRIIMEIHEYIKDTRILCELCGGKFKSENTLNSHEIHFHRVKII